MHFRPVDVAKECNVSVGTVRAWCSDFALFLSDGANPSDGERKLSERDLEVCKYIAQLRKEGMSKPQIALRLSETSFGTVEPTEKPIEKPTEALQAPQTSLQTTPAHTEAAALSVVALEALQKRIDAIEATGKAKTLQFGVSMFALGFCAACLLFFILVYLVSIYAK